MASAAGGVVTTSGGAGAASTGGTVSNGGAAPAGGGGAASSGGTISNGGATPASGGSSSSGGAPTGTGGATGSGGKAAVPACGDGNVDSGESCDDKNLANGDGCSSSCRSEATDIQLGHEFGCAILGDGRLKCWGNGASGQLGTGDLSARGDAAGEMGTTLPVTLRGVTLLVAGRAHACAVSSGELYCWGDNSKGQLGLGVTYTTPVTTPTKVSFALGAPIKSLTSFYDHTCAILSTGALACWGDNARGQLGTGDLVMQPSTTGQALTPVALGDAAVSVATGSNFTCAALASGAVKCWGDNTRGALGLGLTYNALHAETYPTNAVDLGPNFRSTFVSAGTNNCALGSAGSIKCWGNASAGLGYDSAVSIGTDPTQMGVALPNVPLSSVVKQLASGWFENCVVLAAGEVECFGGAVRGMIGRADYGNTGQSTNLGDEPGEMSTLYPLPLGGKARLVRVGRDFACALLETGQIKCWGQNNVGQLGQGSNLDQGDNEGETAALAPTVVD
ncbi:MAG: hypothetical protein QM756_23100 [Polyangiaceae bacterium]